MCGRECSWECTDTDLISSENYRSALVPGHFMLYPVQFLWYAGPPDAVKNLKFNNVPGDVVLSWSPGYPGCQTATCSIQSYVVEVLKRGRCTGKCSHRIEGHRTSVQLISGGMVDSSDEYQIRVSACSALNECGRPVSRSRLIGELWHNYPTVTLLYECVFVKLFLTRNQMTSEFTRA